MECALNPVQKCLLGPITVVSLLCQWAQLSWPVGIVATESTAGNTVDAFTHLAACIAGFLYLSIL